MLRYCIALLLLFVCSPVDATVDFPQSTLTIEADGKRITLIVEIARTAEQQMQGLMFRKSLAEGHGMIFPFSKPGRISMWMKNTMMPLDMVFVDQNGIVTHIVKNTKPLSEDLIDSGGNIKAVLEIKAGSADMYHITEGSHIIFKGL